MDTVQVDVNNKVKYFHVQNTINGKSVRATFATEILDTGEVLIGAAFCTPEDTPKFRKDIGRKIAYGRLQKNGMKIGMDKFTGHSVDSIIRKWKDIPKPTIWKRVQPLNVKGVGLSFVESYG